MLRVVGILRARSRCPLPCPVDLHARPLFRRRRARTERIRLRVEAAWDEVNALVERFRAEDSELSRVVLFGSLAREEVRQSIR
jgi:hypothetical protein